MALWGLSMAIMCLRHLPGSGYAPVLVANTGAWHKTFVALAALAAAVFSYLYAGAVGFAVAAAVIIGYAIAIAVVCKSFKGVSGDLLGFSLVMGELAAMLVFAVAL